MRQNLRGRAGGANRVTLEREDIQNHRPKGVYEMHSTTNERTPAAFSINPQAVLLFAFAAILALSPAVASAEDWYRVESKDGKASVLFPNRAEEVREIVDRTPGGKVRTRVSEHHSEDIMMTLSETKLPHLAMSFAGPKLIFRNAKGIVLHKAFGRELSAERSEIAGADAAMVMHYESVHFEDESHPGYHGLAVFLIVDMHIYVVNSILSKDTADSRAAQEKLLDSIQVQG